MSEGKVSSKRLAEAVKLGKARLAPFQEQRYTFLNEYKGNHYGAKVGEHKEPMNTLFSHASLYVPHLVFRDPRALITTANPELRPMANIFELRWDHMAREIDLRRTLRNVVLDAYFGPGIIKTGLDFGPAINEDGDTDAGYLHDAGQAFADPVDFDDYIIDSQTRSRESCDFEGNRYRVSRDYAFRSGLYDKAILERLMVHSKALKGPARAEDMSTSPGPEDEDIFEYFEFWDLWLPAERMVLTIPADAEATAGYLREQEWQGPERGPYEMLGFHWVPNNPIPLSLASIIFDLHLLININARKAANQAQRQKDVLLYDLTAAKDAETIEGAADGDMLGVQDVSRFESVSYGGTNEKVYEHQAFLEDKVSRLGGNTDLMGGMSAQSKTLGQDEMLMGNASIRIDDMRVQVYDFLKQVGKKLAWYLWTDPQSKMPLTYESEGVSVPVVFSPEQREGDFLDYNFDIVPYSMSPDSPERKYRDLMEIVDHIIVPNQDIAAAQGYMLDVHGLVAQAGRYRNMRELDTIFRSMEPMTGMGGMAAPGGAETTNISLGRAGGTRPEPSPTRESNAQSTP